METVTGNQSSFVRIKRGQAKEFQANINANMETGTIIGRLIGITTFRKNFPIHISVLFIKKFHPYFWLLPLFITMGGLLIYPWLWSLYLSFHTWSLVSVDPIKFVGLENYIDIFSDSRFQLALKNTLLLTVTSVLGQFFLGFILALILNSISSRIANICLVILMIPMMLTPSIISMVWRLLLHPERGVITKYYLKLLCL